MGHGRRRGADHDPRADDRPARARVGAERGRDGPKRSDLIRKEEIPSGRVHSPWDGEMLPAGDDRVPRD